MTSISLFYLKALILAFCLFLSSTLHAQIDSLNRADTLQNFTPKNINDIYVSTDSSSQFVPIATLSDTLTTGRDTVGKSPALAAILSAAIPGAGQVYNRKIYKVPVIYGAFAGLGYLAMKRNELYQNIFTAYSARIDTVEATTDTYFPETATDAEVLNYLQTTRRQRDFTYLWIGIVYVLNIVDASVDAHLSTFDIGDDLSMKVAPYYDHRLWAKNNQGTFGLSLQFKF